MQNYAMELELHLRAILATYTTAQLWREIERRFENAGISPTSDAVHDMQEASSPDAVPGV